MEQKETIAVTTDADERDGSKLGVERLVMRIFPVRSVEWDVEDGVEITVIKVRGTIDACGAGDVIEYQPANEAMDPQTSEVKCVLALLDDLAGQWGDEAVFRRCRDRLRELVQKEATEAHA